MEDLYRHLHMPYELAVEFMASFSRAEYALKSTGYAMGNEGRVDPAWDRYANEIHEEFVSISDEGVKEASDYLLNHPPRKQILDGNTVKYIDQVVDGNQRSTQQVLRMVRTVRNNLFHGGKFLPNGEVETGRNQKLVESSILVLRTCINLRKHVRKSYDN